MNNKLEQLKKNNNNKTPVFYLLGGLGWLALNFSLHNTPELNIKVVTIREMIPYLSTYYFWKFFVMKCVKNRMENRVRYMKDSSIEESESHKK